MTKHYCDRCGKECEKLEMIKIPTQKTRFGFETRPGYVCGSCEEEYNNIINKITDIRFILFRDFMKGADDERN